LIYRNKAIIIDASERGHGGGGGRGVAGQSWMPGWLAGWLAGRPPARLLGRREGSATSRAPKPRRRAQLAASRWAKARKPAYEPTGGAVGRQSSRAAASRPAGQLAKRAPTLEPLNWQLRHHQLELH